MGHLEQATRAQMATEGNITRGIRGVPVPTVRSTMLSFSIPCRVHPAPARPTRVRQPPRLLRELEPCPFEPDTGTATDQHRRTLPITEQCCNHWLQTGTGGNYQ